MLKLKITLEAQGDEVYGFNGGERVVMVNDVFAKDCGIAFNEIKKGWKIVGMEILKYSPIKEK